MASVRLCGLFTVLLVPLSMRSAAATRFANVTDYEILIPVSAVGAAVLSYSVRYLYRTTGSKRKRWLILQKWSSLLEGGF